VSDRLTGDFQSILSFFRLILPDINICPNNLPRDPGLSAFRGLRSKDEKVSSSTSIYSKAFHFTTSKHC
jgi:hypothetical protein